MALGDIDQDGDLDVVCGNGEQTAQPNTLYINNHGEIATDPIWRSEAHKTYSVALGDLDGDGDLDLVCGNLGVNTLYWNRGGTLDETPGWSSDTSNITRSVAFGDVDGDGNLDLVCGNLGGPNTLFRNDGKTLSTTPEEITLTNSTLSVVLGDLNGDGHLDLVSGNVGEPSTIHLNDGHGSFTLGSWTPGIKLTNQLALGDVDGDGALDLVYATNDATKPIEIYLNTNPDSVFSTAPDTTFGSSKVKSIALADVDGDADLDLVCGVEGKNTLFLNDAGTFTQDADGDGNADWESKLTSATLTVALGDLSGDGLPDVVCGNADGANAMYVNQSLWLTSAGTWFAEQTFSTESVALGDIDADGDLDLVCGNDGGANTLYKWNADSLGTVPEWRSAGQPRQTQSVALGDLDGDKRLDLVCGNLSGENTIYRNVGGSLDTIPVIWSAIGTQTMSVALGDVDGDGALDIACGNVGQRNCVHLNDGKGNFNTTPDWQSEPARNTQSVVFADVDNDGDVDLLCGNGAAASGEVNTLYLNLEGTLDVQPTVWQGPQNPTTSIAVGDVNGDGRLDLVCGNQLQVNTLYLNRGGPPDKRMVSYFPNIPDWETESSRVTMGVSLGDVDGDGDLDIAFANDNDRNTVYVNRRGVASVEFTLTPVWESADLTRTRAVLFGDVDSDGDQDLVAANRVGKNTFYGGVRWPPFKGNPIAPRHHLPNNSAFVRFVTVIPDTVVPAESNSYDVRGLAVDVESDSVRLVVEHQFKGAGSWSTVTSPDFSGSFGPLPASPEGTPWQFRWDVSSFPLAGREVVLRMRTISNASRVGLNQHVASYDANVGRIEPRRPEVTAQPDTLRFPPITVGDTTMVTLEVRNRGNEILEVWDVVPSASIPPSSAWADSSAFALNPKRSEFVVLWLAPRTPQISGSFEVMSNDPLHPSLPVPLHTTIHDLDVDTRLLEEQVVLEEDIIVIVTPHSGVRVESGRVFYRPLNAGQMGSFASTTLSPIGNSSTTDDVFLGIVPADSVQEGGMQYYIEVENSGVLGTDPKTAPDSLHFVDVLLPSRSVTAEPQPNLGAGPEFVDGLPVRIDARLATGLVFQSGTLSYRSGGQDSFQTVPLQFKEGIDAPTAIVPEEFVTARGVEYWIEVQTSTDGFTDPLERPDVAPHTLRIRTTNLEEPGTHAGLQYRMLSVPLDFSDFTGDLTLETLLQDQAQFGSYDIVKWRAFRYLRGRNIEFPGEEPNDFEPRTGRAFWLISRESHRFDSAPIPGASTSSNAPVPIQLAPGWNQFGNPFAFPVAWSDVVTLAENASVQFGDLVAYDGANKRYTSPDSPPQLLQPFDGYFVENADTVATVMWVPPREADVTEVGVVSVKPSAGRGVGRFLSEPEWQIRVEARSAEFAGDWTILGVHPDATHGYDDRDHAKPPPPPAEWVSIAVAHAAWKRSVRLYRSDIRAPHAEGWTWDLEVHASAAAREVTVCWTTHEVQGMSIALIDREQDVVVRGAPHGVNGGDPATEHRILAFGPERGYRMAFIVGTDAYVEREGQQTVAIPRRLVLDQNAPNPFNASTRIRYGLPRSGAVTLAIYDSRGRLVNQLLSRGAKPAGFHSVIWNGTDKVGREVGSGVYFYRLTALDRTMTRRVVLIK